MADIIVVHGASGAGKSKQCGKLEQFTCKNKEIKHISIGDRLRGIRNGDIDSMFGELVNSPDAPNPLEHYVVNGIVFESVKECGDNCIILIDGFPRFEDAVEIFAESIRVKGHTLLGCINLKISPQISRERLGVRGIRKGEREFETDFREARLVDYLENTEGSIRRFREITRVIDINGEQGLEATWCEFSKAFLELTQV